MECKNCVSSFEDNLNYCSHCGAKVIRNRLTLKALFADFSQQFLNYDNLFLKTFRHLTTKPEAVIGSYINGTRKKYVNVISYFAIALTLSGFQMFVLNKFFPELMNMDFMPNDGTKEIQQENMSFVQEYQSIVFMLIVPVYAFISKIVFINKKQFNYTEHLVINMYMTAHISIISTILVLIVSLFGVNFGLFGLVSIPFQILFSAYCFKRIFNLSFASIILKTLLFLFLLTALFIIIIIATTVIMYLNGTLDEIREAQENLKKS
ncbi:MAG: DUF3667 domain-containing protein [Flavobacteriaceae bacterium]|nr:DUF3667 domain-containing protein [Flavobacteriaceae bacterium]